MGKSKIMFNNIRQKELDEAGEAAVKRVEYKQRLVQLVKGLKEKKDDSFMFHTLVKIEPYYCFAQYILAVGEAPIWYIEHVLKKYSEDDQYNMKQIHKTFLEGMLLRKKNKNKSLL